MPRSQSGGGGPMVLPSRRSVRVYYRKWIVTKPKTMHQRDTVVFTRFGGDLLSHDLSRSTIGAVALNGRVRKGTGCFAHAMTTKPNKIPQARCESAGSKSSVVQVSTLCFGVVLLVVGPGVGSGVLLFHGFVF